MDSGKFIAAEFDWKSLSLSPSDQVVEVASANATWTRRPQLLGQLNLEITLTKRLPGGLNFSAMRDKKGNLYLNEYYLSDHAFRAKSFIVRIEKGDFVEPAYIGEDSVTYKPRYALRLLFDRSPYPPREEWTKPEGGPDNNNFWNDVEFVGRPLGNKKGTAMNDVNLGGWGTSCSVS